MKFIFGFSKFSGMAVLLSACVGGASDTIAPINPDNAPINPEVHYPFSASYRNDETQSTLGGVAIRSNVATGELQMVTLTGSKDHETRATLVSDGTYTLIDSNGFDGADRISDGHASLSLRPIAQNYTSLRVFDQMYVLKDGRFDSVGILGVITRPAELPSSGTATYLGRSDVIAVTAYEGVSMQGQSMIVADFSGSGSVKVTMDRFVAIDMMTGSTTDAPFDTIIVNDMLISGNRFSGVAVATLKNGTLVTVTGANTAVASEGVFFGYDPVLSKPAEVGGMILMQGNDGIVIGNFLAD